MLRYFLFAVLYFATAGQATYFSMSNIHLNIPADKTKYLPINHPLLTLYAAKEKEGNQEEHPIYSINFAADEKHLLQVFRPTGDIMFTEAFFNETDIRNITVQASVEDTAGMRDTTTIQVSISLQKTPLDCDFMTQDLCFWQSANYKIFENRKPTIIGSLSSPYLAEMCAGHKLNYALLEGGNQFGLVTPSDSNKSWAIRSLELLDRDVVRSMDPFNRKSAESGEYRNVSVQCSVEDPQGAIRKISKIIPVKILDEDDNPPLVRTKVDTIQVHLNSNLVEKGEVVEHSDLIFIDRDSPPVNQYDIKLSGDYLNILAPDCTIYEDDREGESQTFIHCKLIFTKDMQIPDESPYAVALEINDTTLLAGFGNSVAKLPIEVNYLNYHESPKRVARTASPNEFNHLLLYPSKDVAVFKTAAPYARLTQPHKNNLRKGIESFRIHADSSNGAFGVTNKQGIVFVQNVALLRQAPATVTLTIKWNNNDTQQMDQIFIKIVIESRHTCDTRGPLEDNWGFCSNFRNRKSCNKGCGLSTGGSPGFERRKSDGVERCMWRGDENPGTNPTHLYATCTPDIATCPDGVCDSLEEMHELICPQDCARADKIQFPVQVNKKTWQGFDIGEGVCYCNKPLTCLCEYIEPKKKNKEKNATTQAPTVTAVFTNNSIQNFNEHNNSIVQPNVSRHVGGDISKCGTTCILGITGSAVFLLLVIAGVMFCWKLERVHKAVRDKFSNETPDLQVPLSDYVDRAVPPDTLHFNFDVTTTLTTQINRTEPDPKWEFPRSQLRIEQTLGEGEFGRVLRARALDITGQPGYTTVAVKTLKDDAGERELADLLSEYQLLKEVSHPNIIRLLGASTQPGGPVYLIIEFAEQGSLRNYLRRSRHIQTELRITTNRIENLQQIHEPYDEPKTCQITPKDILSFAWQIANGMSYLSDIKLVHRDLAARNVLVADDKICKISDFGLTRDVYEDDAYFKRSKGRVPVKWMAPESLSDHIYTNKSDVWSFGILIWELVTLGASPYPGIVVQSLFHLLKTGYRMERPENCSLVLYKVMRSCWHADPEKRPTFSELSIKIERMLSDEVQYLDLTGNAINNRGYFCDNLDDVEVEVEDENEENTRKTNTNAINYMNRSTDYVKCGNTTKIEVPEEQEQVQEKGGLLISPSKDTENSIGYETPVKIQNKTPEIKTPLNEFPQYGYTDMTACNSK